MRRQQKRDILRDLAKKMVILVGPRQVGKTWLAKEIAKEYKTPVYLNYDEMIDRKTIEQSRWQHTADLLIFDEIHKMPLWKNFVKGVYDTKSPGTHLLVTGSARLETFRKTGDSMAGRFFVHHLLPLSLKELQGTPYADDLERLTERGGFPDPFLATDSVDADKWRQEYVDSLLREDVFDFNSIDKLNAMRNVFEIVRTKVGSSLSYANIAGDAGIAPETVKKYIEIFEALYIVYLVRPYSKKINRAILKSPKLYFYDTGLIKGDQGVVFENLVANALQKHLLGRRDILAQGGELMYVRTKEGHEVDFALVNAEGNLEQLIEAKLSEREPSRNLVFFTERNNVKGVQVVKNIRYGTKHGRLIDISEAKDFLSGLFL